ncbi:ATP-binding protein [Corynebacterium choanae]|uniref:tRNA(Ile)-lysidine synthase n=1 Tax=Corynebacterium choanae TaxID=1862358 RepID=A0A3G6J480_9CORY|nr:ATP-binding protein [Corynebacterium choanae]AZA12746.1 tRNA(Ile)-lysidine synthase [Corynebacterium choanae]
MSRHPQPLPLPTPATPPAEPSYFGRIRCTPARLYPPEPSRQFLRVRNAVAHLLNTVPSPAEHRQQPINVGFSGGIDSLLLVVALRTLGHPVHAIIIDHQIQPGHEHFSGQAAHIATQLGCTTTVATVTVDTTSSNGLEAAAREARYAAFRYLTSTIEYRPGQRTVVTAPPGHRPTELAIVATTVTQPTATGMIMLAHTANDMAENVLLKMLRAEPQTMHSHTAIGELAIVRPLLRIDRPTLLAAARELGIDQFVFHDPMNDDPHYRRVAMRNTVLPMLAEIHGGDVIAPLADYADQQAREQDFLHELTVERLANYQPTATTLTTAIGAEHKVLQERMVRLWLRPTQPRVNTAALNAILAQVNNWKGQGPVAIGTRPDGVRLQVARTASTLVIQPVDAPPATPPTPHPGRSQ